MDQLIWWLLKMFFTKLVPAIWNGIVVLVKTVFRLFQQKAPSAGDKARQGRAGSTQVSLAKAEQTHGGGPQIDGQHVRPLLAVLAALRAAAQQMQDRSQSATGPQAVWRELVEQELIELRALETEWEPRTAAVISLAQAEVLHRAVEHHQLRNSALNFGFAYRGVPAQGEMMADADAVARAMLEPITQFAKVQNLPLPQRRPVCFPAGGKEAVWFGLFPKHYPVVFVPDDFKQELLRWPAVAHEIGHILWQGQALRQELEALAIDEAEEIGWDGADDFETADYFEYWLEEVFCDLVATLLLGPAAVRGMLHLFGDFEDPAELLFAFWDPERGRSAEHPPPHLRVHLCLEVLQQMGFSASASALREQWLERAGAPESYLLPIDAQRFVQLSPETLQGPGRQLVQRLFRLELQSLGGYRISTIPGFVITSGIWARVEAERDAILSAHYAPPCRLSPTDARVVIAAAIEARGTQPQHLELIAGRVSAAIVGVGEVEHIDTPVTAQTQPSQVSFNEELMQALVLSEVLAPKNALTRHRSHRR